MLGLDVAPLPRRAQSHGPGLLALAISLGLHTAALACFIVFREVTPPVPYAVIAVDLIQAADVVGIPGTAPAGQSQSSLVAKERSVGVTEVVVDPEQTADVSPQDGTAEAIAPPSSNLNPSVEREEKPTRISAQGPTPENTPTRRSVVPEPPGDTSRVAAPPRPPADPLEATSPIPPAPRRKPRHFDRPPDRKLAESAFEKHLTETKETPTRPVDQESVRDATHTGVSRTLARIQQATTRDERKDDAVAALPAAVRSSGLAGNVGDGPGTLPKYSGGGLSNAAPRYPYLARRRGQEGRVVLRVQVTADGEAAAVQLRQSSGYRLLDKAAVEAAKTWRFVPARRGGIAVAGSVEVPVSFKLRD